VEPEWSGCCVAGACSFDGGAWDSYYFVHAKERWAIMDFVILSIVMLGIGIYGLLTNRQLLKVFISVELIATAATLNFVMLVTSAGQG
jgi:hypothetical protein